MPARSRYRILVRGAVQGVGFRPFVHRLATRLGLQGWVQNTPDGVRIEAEGPKAELLELLRELRERPPPHSLVEGIEHQPVPPREEPGFSVLQSGDADGRDALILPDLATCEDCLREILDPSNRRFRYAFTNCTHCGPRFSILLDLPYDRANTTMARFRMCAECQAEYDSPADRRFHAQPNACPRCGPRLALLDAGGRALASGDDALIQAARALSSGAILAVKGLGGFHLLADACDEAAVRRLRERKRRERKPFALMAPGLADIREHCAVSEAEARLLTSAEAPIVLLRRLGGGRIASAVAPDNPWLGFLLPYSPLHHLLMAELGRPAVATSGNLAEEPICTEENEALIRLADVAELFLIHDRPIARPVDDSVARISLARTSLLRRSRGYAPLPAALGGLRRPVLCVGGHLKNTIALAARGRAFLSQHIGDLETPRSLDALRGIAGDLGRMLDVRPEAVVCDLHPGYASTAYAEATGLPVLRVQHHHAHALACMAEHALEPPVTAFCWDGTGYGPDGTVWGGETLRILEAGGFERLACWRPFPLPGGEAAIRQPRRSALGLIYAMQGRAGLGWSHLPPVQEFSDQERRLLGEMLDKGLRSPLTSSVGRLFDAVASLAGLCQTSGFEGEAAMRLEFEAERWGADEAAYPVALERSGGPMLLDWEPMLRRILQDLEAGAPAGLVASRFHANLAEAIVAVAEAAGEEVVALGGGCFQNRRLTERTVLLLGRRGFRAYVPELFPANDGGLALGQALAAAIEQRKE